MKRLLILLTLAACEIPKEEAPAPAPAQPAPAPAPLPFKSLFPEPKWTEHALKLVKNSKLVMVVPVDAHEFCPKGMSAENWVHLLASMTKYESSFKPGTTYQEKFKNSKGEWVISTGLLQISYESARGYGFKGITTEDLKDPFKNLEVGVAILEKWVVSDGRIASEASPWRGGARYWSVLRGTGKLSSVKTTLKGLCQ